MNKFDKKLSGHKDIISKEASTTKSVIIRMDQIDENEKNERIFNMRGIQELADFIKQEGFYQPIVVFQKEDGRYEILMGHRKFRAKKLLGENTIDAIVQVAPKSEGERVFRLIFDNINARVLTPMDMARAMNEIRSVWIPEQREKGAVSGDTKDILAEMFHTSPSKVSRTLRLINLIEPLQEKIDSGTLSVDAALALLQDENRDVKGLQEFVDDIIGEKENEQEQFSKVDMQKLINSFKNQGANEEKSKTNEIKPEVVVSKMKFIKGVGTLRNIINARHEDGFILEADEVEELENLKHQITEMIDKYKK